MVVFPGDVFHSSMVVFALLGLVMFFLSIVVVVILSCDIDKVMLLFNIDRPSFSFALSVPYICKMLLFCRCKVITDVEDKNELSLSMLSAFLFLVLLLFKFPLWKE